MSLTNDVKSLALELMRDATSPKSLSETMKAGKYSHNPLMAILVRKGPVGLLELAEEHGYVPKAGYVSKCHLCHETRTALRQYYPEFLGPEAVYVE